MFKTVLMTLGALLVLFVATTEIQADGLRQYKDQPWTVRGKTYYLTDPNTYPNLPWWKYPTGYTDWHATAQHLFKGCKVNKLSVDCQRVLRRYTNYY